MLPVLVFLVGKQIVYGLLLMLLQDMQAVPQGEIGILANGLADAVIIPVMWKCFLHSTSESNAQTDHSREQQNLTAGIWQIYLFCLLGIGFCLAGNGLLQLTGLVNLLAGDYSNTMEVLYGGTLWVQMFWMVIAAPVAEELVYRKILYGRMREYCSFGKAAAGTSFLFGITHGFILQGIYSFLLGMLLCFLVERYKKLYPAILVHMMANLCSVVSTVCVPVQSWLSDRGNYTAAVLVSVLVCILLIRHLAKAFPSPDLQEDRI